MELPIIGVSPDIVRIREQVRQIAHKGLRVIIMGETGVGKEVVAQNIYHRSPQKGRPFIKLKFPDISDSLNDINLFGIEQQLRKHVDGAAARMPTDALHGVYFFDEIGDMPCPIQSRLLTFLEKFHMPPTTTECNSKDGLWIIATTRCDLVKKVKCGDFKEALYSQLNIINIYISPLRQRPEDIPPLIDYFIDQYTPQFSNRHFLRPDYRILDSLMAYHWPGNVWELQRVVKKFLTMGDWDEIIETLPVFST